MLRFKNTMCTLRNLLIKLNFPNFAHYKLIIYSHIQRLPLKPDVASLIKILLKHAMPYPQNITLNLTTKTDTIFPQLSRRFATAHGKGVIDGVGGTLKRMTKSKGLTIFIQKVILMTPNTKI